MNALGISLAWLALQVTLLTAATAIVYLLVRRRHPTAGETAILAGLLLSTVLTIGIVSPWPCWTRDDAGTGAVVTEPRGEESVTDRLVAEALKTSPSDEGTASAALLNQLRTAHTESKTDPETAEVRGRSADDRESMSSTLDAGDRWGTWFAVLVIVPAVIGAVRFVGGWLSVRACVRRSRVLQDAAINELVQGLAAQLACRRVEVRESVELASAATVGWRRPIILLPGSWREWTDSELRAVLAHELAHVSTGDAALWLAAQFGLSLQFYHPLVHWLTGRLRLEQELSADAVAATLIGNPQQYLTSLVELAVRQPHESLAWPARSFLATSGTLVRRIEMLRSSGMSPLKSTRLQQAAITALILAVGVGASGFRPLAPRSVNAQTPADRNTDPSEPQGQSNSDARSNGETAATQPQVNRVVDTQGKPIAGATLEFTTQLRYSWIEPPPPLATAVTNEAGEFTYPETLPDLDQFFVIVNADGFMERFWTANGDVYRKVEGARQPDTLTLLRPATISGTILDERGEPLAGAGIAVDYYFDAGPACINCIRVTSDEKGKFMATDVPPANVFVRYESPSTAELGEWPGPTGVQPAKFCVEYVQPADGETKDVVLDLRTANRVVEGRVVDPSGQGLAGVAVEAGFYPAINRIDETIAMKTDAEGRFRFTGLTADTFVIGLPHFGPYDSVTLTKEEPASVVLTKDPYRRGSDPSPRDVESTTWGEPYTNGLVAGLRLEPAAESYTIGDAITANVIVRNPTSETKTFEYSFSAYASLDAVDTQGNRLAWINYFHFTGLNAIFTYSLEPGQEVLVGRFSFTLTAAGDTENSPPGGFTIPCPPNEPVVLRCQLYANSDNKWPTGDVRLQLKDRPTE